MSLVELLNFQPKPKPKKSLQEMHFMINCQENLQLPLKDKGPNTLNLIYTECVFQNEISQLKLDFSVPYCTLF